MTLRRHKTLVDLEASGGWIDGWVAGWMDWWMNSWVDGWKVQRMDQQLAALGRNKWISNFQDGWVAVWVNGLVNEWVSEWVSEWMGECVDGWVNIWVDGCPGDMNLPLCVEIIKSDSFFDPKTTLSYLYYSLPPSNPITWITVTSCGEAFSFTFYSNSVWKTLLSEKREKTVIFKYFKCCFNLSAGRTSTMRLLAQSMKTTIFWRQWRRWWQTKRLSIDADNRGRSRDDDYDGDDDYNDGDDDDDNDHDDDDDDDKRERCWPEGEEWSEIEGRCWRLKTAVGFNLWRCLTRGEFQTMLQSIKKMLRKKRRGRIY